MEGSSHLSIMKVSVSELVVFASFIV